MFLALPGCGTLSSQLQMNGGRCPDPRNGMITSPVYSGVVYDWRGMVVPPGDRAHLYDIFFLVDLPFSAVADTLILPFTLDSGSDQPAPGTLTAEGFREYHGFAVRALKDSRWKLNRRVQQPNVAVFDLPPLSPTHKTFATVACVGAPSEMNSIDDLKKAFDAEKQEIPDGSELLSRESHASTHKGRECLVYSMRILNKAPRKSSTPLIMTFDGISFIHPDSNRLVVEMMFSEQGKEDEIGQGTEELRKDFLDSIEIRSIK
jgi:uncharacterized protein YceK